MDAFSRTLRMGTRPSRLRSSGVNPIPRAIASAGLRMSTTLPSISTVPPRPWQLAEDDLGELGAPCADEPGEADDLAAADLEVDGRGARCWSVRSP